MADLAITMKREGELVLVNLINMESRQCWSLAFTPLQLATFVGNLQRTATGPDSLDKELDALLIAAAGEDETPEAGES